MTNIEKYNKFCELLSASKELDVSLQDKNITVAQSEALQATKKQHEKELNSIANELYSSFIMFAKERDDLFDYDMRRHYFYKNYYSGFERKLKSDGSIVVRYGHDCGEWHDDNRGHIIVPFDFVHDVEGYEHKRKKFMLEHRIKYTKGAIAEKQKELDESIVQLSVLEKELAELESTS